MPQAEIDGMPFRPRLVRRLRRHWRDIAVAAWYAVLTAIFLWPLISQIGIAVPEEPGDPQFHATLLDQMSRNILAGDLAHLFDAPFFYPSRAVLAFSDSLLTLQPVALPLRAVLGDPIAVVSILIVASFPLTAIAADAYGRLIHGSRLAGWVAGTVFAFSAFRFAHVVHVNLLQMWALPLVFLSLELVLRRRSWGAAIVWAMAHLFVAGVALHYLLFLALAEPLYLGVRILLEPKRREAFRRVLILIAPVVVVAVVVLLMLGPYLELRGEGYTRAEASIYPLAARPLDYLAPAPSTLWLTGIGSPVVPASGRYERELSPGYLALVLAVIGLVVGIRHGDPSRRSAVVAWLAVGLFAFALSLGPRAWPNEATQPVDVRAYPELPYAWLARIFPLESLRAPARFGVLVLLGVAVLAGGAMTIRVDGRHRLRRRLLEIAPGAIAAVFVIEYAVAVPTVQVAWGRTLPPVYVWLAQQPGGAVMELPAQPFDINAKYLLYMTLDRHPRLNGYSGFRAHGSEALFRQVSVRSVAAWLDAVRSRGGRYLIAHEDRMTPAARAAIDIAARRGDLLRTQRFGHDQVYEVVLAP